jgi:hypothetical protein
MRFRLRTLLIVLALGPVVLWAAWWLWNELSPHQGFIVQEFIDFGDGRGPQPIEKQSP